MKIFSVGNSLGDVGSLVQNTAIIASSFNVPVSALKAKGIDENFVRLSVGIETEADLIADIKSALAKM